MNDTVRPMRWWDLDAVVAIERASFAVDAWSVETFWSELAERGSRTYLVAAESAPGSAGTRLIGYVGIAVVGDDADVQTLAVEPGRRSRGLGRTLLRRGLAVAAERGARQIHLEVRADNSAAISLYDAEGFRRTGKRRGYYRNPAGSSVDAILMRRQLLVAGSVAVPEAS